MGGSATGGVVKVAIGAIGVSGWLRHDASHRGACMRVLVGGDVVSMAGVEKKRHGCATQVR